MKDQYRHRRSIRLQGYDYSQPGAYFVTLVTYQRSEIFGTIDEHGVNLSQMGKIVREEWFKSVELRQEIQLYDDEFVIMPNHIHGILWIADRDQNVAENNPDRSLIRNPRSLPSFVAGFKSSVTRRVRNELGISGVWQRNYYEHIIRDDLEYEKIMTYIGTNPLRWQMDQLNPHGHP